MTANISRKIDTLLSSGLFTLPIPGAEPDRAFYPRAAQHSAGARVRTPERPSGRCASEAGRSQLHVYTNAEIAAAIPRLAHSMIPPTNARLQLTNAPETPLWLYILAESKIVHDGRKLGPTGSRIVAEVFGGLLAGDADPTIGGGGRPLGAPTVRKTYSLMQACCAAVSSLGSAPNKPDISRLLRCGWQS